MSELAARVVQAANQRVLSPLAQCSSRAGGFLNRAADATTDYLSLVNNFGRGAVSETGARIVQSLSLRSRHRAARAYDSIRNSVDDVSRIARNTGIPEFRVARIKDHVFHRLHRLEGRMARFDPDPRMVGAWRRLTTGTHSARDVRLLKT